MLTITTPASSPALLTAVQLRAAAGLASGDASQDSELAIMGLQVAANIASACDIAVGIGGYPTLNQETLTETFRCVNLDVIVLGRRHEVSITSVSVDGTLLDPADYEVEAETGQLFRLAGTLPVRWRGQLISIVYKAGFASVPDELVGAASDMVRLRRSEEKRDPMLKGEMTEVPDVLTKRQDYWVGGFPAGGVGGIPSHIMQRLTRFINTSIG